MPSGPPPKPTKLKLLQGNPGHRPILQDAIDLPVEAPEAPDYVLRVPEAKREWERVVGKLMEYELLATFDLAALASYCTAYALLIKCENWLADHPNEFIEMGTNGMPCCSPWLKLRDQTQKEVRQWCAEFGFTPAQRSRVSKAPVNERKGKPTPAKKAEGWQRL